MLLIIKFLAKIFSLLNSEISPRQIAAGFAFGALIGLLPANGLLPYVLLLIAFIINFNLAALFLAAAIFKIISFLVDPLANQIGFVALAKVKVLVPFWTALYNAPLIPYTRFYNTIVMGSLIVGIFLLVPAYFAAKSFVNNYRARWREKVLKFKVVQIVKASSFYKYYESYKTWTGE